VPVLAWLQAASGGRIIGHFAPRIGPFLDNDFDKIIREMSESKWPLDPYVCGIVAVGMASWAFLSSKRKIGSAHRFAGDEIHDHDPPGSESLSSYSQPSGVGQAHPYSRLPEYKGCVYLDYNATTPVFPEVTGAMVPYLTTSFGNPSSSHIFSAPCREALRKARSHVGALVNARDPSKEIYFTSCGTESDNRAVDIALHHFTQFKKRQLAERGVNMSVTLPHVVTCKTEHPAVICYLRILVLEQKIRMTVLPVDAEGFVGAEAVRNALTPNTALVTLMHSNNEVGTIHPLKEIAQAVRQYNQQMRGESCVLLHSDAAQSLGKVLVDVQALDLDMLTIVGHKFGAPKGVAALYMREGIEAPPMLVGGGQERGLRSGKRAVRAEHNTAAALPPCVVHTSLYTFVGLISRRL
jgi:cysteine sulfinate desulfinase/cysteine desulfurase-like protein